MGHFLSGYFSTKTRNFSLGHFSLGYFQEDSPQSKTSRHALINNHFGGGDA